jgi:hypothetical protein
MTLEQDSAWSLLVERLKLWGTEYPKIFMGLYKMADQNFRFHAWVIFCFNAAIVTWSTIQPFILAWGVMSFEAKVPYFVIVVWIVVPMFVITFPKETGLPLLRDLYIAWFFTPKIDVYLTMLPVKEEAPTHSDLLDKQGGPVAEEGRTVVLTLMESLLRDPIFALRGVVILVILGVINYQLGLLILLGMTLDFFAALWAEVRLDQANVEQQGLEQERKKLVNLTHDKRRRTAKDREALEKKATQYNEATRRVDVRKKVYQILGRGWLAFIFQVLSMCLMAFMVHMEELSIANYIVLTQLVPMTGDLTTVFRTLQSLIMSKRETLRWYCLQCDLDFGLTKTV